MYRYVRVCVCVWVRMLGSALVEGKIETHTPTTTTPNYVNCEHSLILVCLYVYIAVIYICMYICLQF